MRIFEESLKDPFKDLARDLRQNLQRFNKDPSKILQRSLSGSLGILKDF